MNTYTKLPLTGFLRLLRLFVGIFGILLIAGPALAQDTLLKIVSEPGDPIGQGVTEVLGLADATFTLGKDYDGGAIFIGVTRKGSDTGWGLGFRAPLNGPLTPGVYNNVALWTNSGSTEPELYVKTRSGFMPWKISGRFEVKKIVYGPDREIRAFWATFEQSSNDSSASLSGEIRYNADSTEISVNQPPAVLAQSAKVVAVGADLEISARVQDDGLPAPATLSAHWSFLTGPGMVTFDDAHSLRTTARFSAPGDYVLNLDVSDGEKRDSSQLFVRAVDPKRPTFVRASLGDGASEGFGQQVLIDQYSYDNGDIPFGRFYQFPQYRDEVRVEFPGKGGVDIYFRSAYGVPLLPGRYEHASGGPGEAQINFVSGLINSSYWDPNPGDSSRHSFEIYELKGGDNDFLDSFWAVVELQRSAFVQPHLIEVRYYASEASLPNRPPLVSAGQDFTMPRNAIVRLRGNALDSSLPEGISQPILEWSKISGPGEVTFADTTAPQTNVTFSIPGVYVLRLSASDGTFTSADDITVTIVDGESGFFQRTQGLLTGNSVQVRTPGEYFFYGTVSADRNSVTVYAGKAGASGGNSEPFTFYAPEGQVLKPGFYSNAKYGSASASPDYARMHSYLFTGTEGSFDVKELEVGEDGSLHALRIVYGIRSQEYTYGSGPAAYQGEIRFNARLAQMTPNQPPLLQASSDLIVQPGTTLRLNASLVDDVQPFATNLSVQWEQLEGPKVAITNPDFLVSEVHLSKPGTYRFRITASDTELTNASLVTVVVSQRAEKFQGLISFQGVPAGEFSIVLTRGNHFTGRLRLQGKTSVIRGQLVNGVFQQTYRQADGELLSLSVARSLDGIQIGGEISSYSQWLTFEAQQDIAGFLKAKGQKLLARGLYTMTFSPEDSNGPEGAGFSSLKVSPYGSWRAALRLADGTSTLTSGSFAVDGTVSLFAELYRRKGWLAGKLKVNYGNPATTTITGPLAWSRPAGKPGRFGDGFAQILSTRGMRYLPASGDPFGTGGLASTLQLGFTSSGEGPLNATIQLPPKSLVGTSKSGTTADIKFAPGTGIFSGHFRNAAGESQPFSGALLQGLGSGLGFFLTPTGSGHVELMQQ